MQSPEAAGAVYDLGYRRYEGLRRGRGHAILALYLHSLRGAFGLGRGAGAKILPFVLTGIALVPAAIALGINAVADVVEPIRYDNYYDLIEIILGIFGAVVAGELVARDQRQGVLTLYLVRPILRTDYALAKLAALVSAMLIIALAPQVLLFIGNSFAGEDVWSYMRDHLDRLLPIAGSGLGIAVLLSSVALAIAAHTPRRALGTTAILAVFFISTAIAEAIVHGLSGDPRRFAVLAGAFDLLSGLTAWLFGATPEGALAEADLPGALYLLAALVFAGLGVLALLRRYRTITV